MTKVSEYTKRIEEKLESYIPKPENGSQDELFNAMKYSLLAGGKRIRPILALEFCRVCSGEMKKALPFACACEMIHTYSLIHDDLPCMDNDDMRRGKPSNHKMFGEDIALLAGDALLNLAFETMLSKEAVEGVGFENALAAARELANKSGSLGMIKGQVIDLKSEGKEIGIDLLKSMDKNKTGALIEAACVIGCIVAGANERKINAARKFAESIGLAFQIMDDILDVTSSEDVLGKPIESDINNKKSTYVSILGIDKSMEIVNELTDTAIASLEEMDGDVAFLKDFSISLKERKK